ncbi:MAG: hypothetical protein K9L26_01135 [Candidatus Izimaplasma sp.]|nr:hypothetical protein [Candidatus Izimaplasma bacterium]
MKLRYGLLNNHLVHVNKVVNGLGCGCICPYCKKDLVAKNKGKKKEHHFAHHEANDCQNGGETALHLLAKKILKKEKIVMLPKLSIGFDDFTFDIIKTEQKTYVDVAEETPHMHIIPDIALYDAYDNPLFVEIKVTHKVDDFKLKKIKQMNQNVIEIDLSDSDFYDSSELKDFLQNSANKRTWLHHTSMPSIHRFIDKAIEKKEIIQRVNSYHVDDCPLEKKNYYGAVYANVKQHCKSCPYNLHQTKTHLFCSNKSNVTTPSDFKAIKAITLTEGFIKSILFHDGTKKTYQKSKVNCDTVFNLYHSTNRQRIMVKNVITRVAFLLTEDPKKQLEKKRAVYGIMYCGKKAIPKRLIGVDKKQWILVPNKEENNVYKS